MQAMKHKHFTVYYGSLNRRPGRSLHNQYGPGEGVIWMDNVQCVGTETDLDDCEHNGWALHNCIHSEDVSISCGIGKKIFYYAPTSVRRDVMK